LEQSAGRPSSSQDRRRPATGVERVTARRLAEAKQTIPHFYVFAEAEITRLRALREELNTHSEFPRLTVTHFVIAAVGRALRQMPEMNVVWDRDEVVLLGDCDVGVAVDTPRGLLVPVIRGADRLPLDDIGRTTAVLTERAREGKLKANELEGGAISVSNVGMFGASHLVPIINPGQAAILGVAAARQVFRPDAGGAPLLVHELGLVLSCDHRVLDGVKAARFLAIVTGFLQRPLALLRAGWAETG
jgi:pyruvate dehydrogenase E2 component (dihydrolipoamide acetyltransferase)